MRQTPFALRKRWIRAPGRCKWNCSSTIDTTLDLSRRVYRGPFQAAVRALERCVCPRIPFCSAGQGLQGGRGHSKTTSKSRRSNKAATSEKQSKSCDGVDPPMPLWSIRPIPSRTGHASAWLRRRPPTRMLRILRHDADPNTARSCLRARRGLLLCSAVQGPDVSRNAPAVQGTRRLEDCAAAGRAVPGGLVDRRITMRTQCARGQNPRLQPVAQGGFRPPATGARPVSHRARRPLPDVDRGWLCHPRAIFCQCAEIDSGYSDPAQ